MVPTVQNTTETFWLLWKFKQLPVHDRCTCIKAAEDKLCDVDLLSVSLLLSVQVPHLHEAQIQGGLQDGDRDGVEVLPWIHRGKLRRGTNWCWVGNPNCHGPTKTQTRTNWYGFWSCAEWYVNAMYSLLRNHLLQLKTYVFNPKTYVFRKVLVELTNKIICTLWDLAELVLTMFQVEETMTRCFSWRTRSRA